MATARKQYWKDYAAVTEAREGIGRYPRFYNYQRRHSSADNRNPASVYFREDRRHG